MGFLSRSEGEAGNGGKINGGLSAKKEGEDKGSEAKEGKRLPSNHNISLGVECWTK